MVWHTWVRNKSTRCTRVFFLLICRKSRLWRKVLRKGPSSYRNIDLCTISAILYKNHSSLSCDCNVVSLYFIVRSQKVTFIRNNRLQGYNLHFVLKKITVLPISNFNFWTRKFQSGCVQQFEGTKAAHPSTVWSHDILRTKERHHHLKNIFWCQSG